MDSSDPDALRAYLSGRVPADLVDRVLQHLEDADTFSEPPPDLTATQTRDLKSVLPGLSFHTQVDDDIHDQRAHVARLPTLARDANSGDHEVLPVSIDPREIEKPILPSETRVRHFQVSRLLGRGGMGEVYLARDTQLGRKVALKVIKPALVRDQGNLVRFLKEARVTARFNHPHIVTIYAVGEFQGMPFVALEYLEGMDLSERLREEELGLQESLRVGLAVADAISEAHKHGILHRDLKPANILIPRDGRVRVVDFGLAQEVTPVGAEPGSEQAETLDSPNGPIIGTPAYMAPEQWKGLECSDATDVWALGMIMHEMICGTRPYTASNLLKLGTQVASSAPVELDDAIAGLPPRIAQLIESCLSKEPSQRPKADSLRDALSEVLTDSRRPHSSEESPFRGLLPFSERHSDVFFGRDTELNTCMERLRYEPSLVVVGPSGAGKTSFVQAGLIPRLKENNDWTVVRIRPGERPIERLATRVFFAHDDLSTSNSLRDSFTGRSSFNSLDTADFDFRAQEIDALAVTIRKNPNKLGASLIKLATQRQSKVLLLIDQLEELFTLCRDPEEQAAFIEAVSSAADEAVEPIRVLCTVRDDFLGHVARAGESARGLLEHVMILEPPGQEALKEVLTLPLLRVGYSFDDPHLADEMVSAVDDASSLPLLQFAARTLWDRRDTVNHRLRRADYEAMGGVEGALARHADDVLHGLSHQELQIARTLLLRLVTPESTRRVRSEQQLLDGLPVGTRPVFERLTKSRLLSIRRSSTSSDDGTRLELAHESLIHNWSRLARWIEESKEELIILNEVSQAAELWERRGRNEEELWSGSGLAEAQRILGRGDTELSSLVESFMEAGRIRDEKRRNRRRFWSVSIPLFLITVAAILFLQKMDAEDSREQSERGRLQALHQRKTAENQRKTAEQRQIEALMESAQTAYTEGNTIEVRAKFRNALELAKGNSGPFLGLWWQLTRLQERWSTSIGSHLYQVIFSADGRYAATAAMNGSVELFDPVSGARRVLRGHHDQVIRVAFSADSSLLASGGYGENIHVWDTASGEPKYVLPKPQGPIRSIVFSGDSTHLAVATNEKRIRMWRLGEEPTPEDFNDESGNRLYDIAFDGSGQLVVARGIKSKLVLTGINAATRVRTLATKINTRSHERARFSPDGRRVAWLGGKTTARIWDVNTGRLLSRIRGGALTLHHQFDLSWTGSHLAMPGPDEHLDIYAVDSGQQVGSVKNTRGSLGSLAVSPDGRLVMATAPGYVSLSDATMVIPERGPSGKPSAVYALAIDPQGREIISASNTGNLFVWDMASGQQKKPYPGMNGGNRDSVTYSDDGRFIAWADRDGRIRIWNRERDTLQAKFIAGLPSRDGLPPTTNPQGLRFDRNASRLIYLDANWVTAWNLSSRKRLFLHRYKNPIDGALAISSDGRRGLVSHGSYGSEGGFIELWDFMRPGRLAVLRGHEGLIPGVGYDPKGRYLVTADWAGTALRWSRDGRAPKPLFQGQARVNHIATHKDGDRVAFAMTNGNTRVMWMDKDKTLELKGHVSEVNHVAYSADGRFLVSGGDDGTIRPWDAESGRPLWRTRALLANPPRLLTHRGWSHLGTRHKADAVSTSSQWMQRLAQEIERSANHLERPWLCLLTDKGEIELWDTAKDRRLWSTQLSDVREVLAISTGCLVRTPHTVTAYSIGGQATTFPLQANPKAGTALPVVSALSVVGDDVLIATGSVVHRFSLRAEPKARYPLSQGISALTLSAEKKNGPELLVVGFDDGSVETLALDSVEYGYNTQVVLQRSARVTRIVPVKGSLIAIGMANGWTGLWDAASRRLLNHVDLHGSIDHLLAEGNFVHVASDLGQSFSWDVSVFSRDLCSLTQDMWSKVPVKWLYGQAVKMPPPTQHRCQATTYTVGD